MKILVVHPGAEFSLPDVYDGIKHGLARAGADTIPYRLDGRIHRAVSWLEHVWEQRDKDSVLTEPTFADALYLASRDIIEMAWEHAVDWVILVSGVYLHPHCLKQFDRPRNFQIGALFTESPYMDGHQGELGEHVDMCWVNDLASVERIRAHNPATYYLPTGYDAARHVPGPPITVVPAHDVVFVGGGLVERIALLEAVDWSGINLGLYGRWQLLGESSPLRKYVRQRTLDEIVPNDVAADLYRAAKIGLNLYRTSTIMHADAEHVGGAYSLNPRAYELAATKTFQLSEYRPEIVEVFGGSVPYFFDAQELQARLRWFLDHPDDRERSAQTAYDLVQRHSYDERAKTLLDTIATGAPRETVTAGG